MSCPDTIPPRRVRAAALLAVAVSVTLSAGCVERWLLIESTPTGASLRINGEDAGTTPARVPFTHYGTYRIQLESPGFEVLQADVPIRTPLWQVFPFDLFADVLIPWTITDERRLDFSLRGAQIPTRDALAAQAEALTSGHQSP